MGGVILTALLGIGALALAVGSFLGLPLFFGAGGCGAVASSTGAGASSTSGVFGSCTIVSSSCGAGGSSTACGAGSSSSGATGSKDTDILFYYRRSFRQEVLH